MSRIILLVLLMALTKVSYSAEKFNMKQVIDFCISSYEKERAGENDFSKIADCIRNVYTSHGTDPNSSTVKSFYVFLEEIDESFKTNSFSYIKSKAQLIRSWQETIEINNIRIQEQANQQALENQRMENLQRLENQRRSRQLLDSYIKRGGNCFPSPANNYTC